MPVLSERKPSSGSTKDLYVIGRVVYRVQSMAVFFFFPFLFYYISPPVTPGVAFETGARDLSFYIVEFRFYWRYSVGMMIGLS